MSLFSCSLLMFSHILYQKENDPFFLFGTLLSGQHVCITLKFVNCNFCERQKQKTVSMRTWHQVSKQCIKTQVYKKSCFCLTSERLGVEDL